MPLVNPISFVKRAQALGVAVPAFNVHNLETIQAVVEGVILERTPVIIQTSPGSLKHIGLDYVVAIIKAAAERTDMMIALQMDHCNSYNMLVQCLRAGYTSLMVDSSALQYEKNIDFTQQIVKMAHCCDVCVEGELGKIVGTEDDLTVDDREATMTVPSEAADYVRRTGIDMLAIAIGTAHGVYVGEPNLDFERLEAIAKEVSLPLVLHGASGVDADKLTESIKRGICKINIATDFKIPFADAIKAVFRQNPAEDDPRVYLGAGRSAVLATVRQKIHLFGASGLHDKL